MNVKQWIPNVQSELFKKLDNRKHADFRGGFEPIPDIVIFSSAVDGDWRRRRRDHTIRCMLVAIEVKASERAGKRLTPAEVSHDIRKLSAHREEAQHLGYDFYPMMIVVDSAREHNERMTAPGVAAAQSLSMQTGIDWRYVGPPHGL